MKLSTILPSTLFGVGIIAAPIAQSFTLVPLEDPQDWIAGPSLFPSNIIAGYHADLEEYNTTSWSNYILEKCKSYDQCTSSETFSAINSGTPKIRYWFGYVYRGGPTTQEDYERVDGVQDSIAYTIVEG